MTAFEAKAAGTLAEENMRRMGIDWVSFDVAVVPRRPRIRLLVVVGLEDEDVKPVNVARGSAGPSGWSIICQNPSTLGYRTRAARASSGVNGGGTSGAGGGFGFS